MIRLAGRDIVGPVAWLSTATSTTAASWRTQRPVLDVAKCVGCMACWKFCPEPAIRPEGSKVAISLGLCKGCGICAAECPVDAIRMDPEVA